jgi:hypothetical protein
MTWTVASLIGFFVAAVGAVRYFGHDKRLLRKMNHVAATKIASARDQETVKIIGRLEYLLQPLTAPLSGRACAYYYVCAEERNEDVFIEEMKQDFLVRDDDGNTAIVRMGASTALAREDAHFFSASFRGGQLTGAMTALLIRHGKTPMGYSAAGSEFERDVSFTEALFEAGDYVAVVGRARWVVDASAEATTHYREIPRRLVLGDGQTAVYASNDPSATGSHAAKASSKRAATNI